MADKKASKPLSREDSRKKAEKEDVAKEKDKKKKTRPFQIFFETQKGPVFTVDVDDAMSYDKIVESYCLVNVSAKFGGSWAIYVVSPEGEDIGCLRDITDQSPYRTDKQLVSEAVSFKYVYKSGPGSAPTVTPREEKTSKSLKGSGAVSAGSSDSGNSLREISSENQKSVKESSVDSKEGSKTVRARDITVTLESGQSSVFRIDSAMEYSKLAKKIEKTFEIKSKGEYALFVVSPDSKETIGCAADVDILPYALEKQLKEEKIPHVYIYRLKVAGEVTNSTSMPAKAKVGLSVETTKIPSDDTVDFSASRLAKGGENDASPSVVDEPTIEEDLTSNLDNILKKKPVEPEDEIAKLEREERIKAEARRKMIEEAIAAESEEAASLEERERLRKENEKKEELKKRLEAERQVEEDRRKKVEERLLAQDDIFRQERDELAQRRAELKKKREDRLKAQAEEQERIKAEIEARKQERLKRREFRQKDEEEFFGMIKSSALDPLKHLANDEEKKKQLRQAERAKILAEREKLLKTGLDEEDLPERLRAVTLDDSDEKEKSSLQNEEDTKARIRDELSKRKFELGLTDEDIEKEAASEAQKVLDNLKNVHELEKAAQLARANRKEEDERIEKSKREIYGVADDENLEDVVSGTQRQPQSSERNDELDEADADALDILSSFKTKGESLDEYSSAGASENIDDAEFDNRLKEKLKEKFLSAVDDDDDVVSSRGKLKTEVSDIPLSKAKTEAEIAPVKSPLSPKEKIKSSLDASEVSSSKSVVVGESKSSTTTVDPVEALRAKKAAEKKAREEALKKQLEDEEAEEKAAEEQRKKKKEALRKLLLEAKDDLVGDDDVLPVDEVVKEKPEKSIVSPREETALKKALSPREESVKKALGSNDEVVHKNVSPRDEPAVAKVLSPREEPLNKVSLPPDNESGLNKSIISPRPAPPSKKIIEPLDDDEEDEETVERRRKAEERRLQRQKEMEALEKGSDADAEAEKERLKRAEERRKRQAEREAAEAASIGTDSGLTAEEIEASKERERRAEERRKRQEEREKEKAAEEAAEREAAERAKEREARRKAREASESADGATSVGDDSKEERARRRADRLSVDPSAAAAPAVEEDDAALEKRLEEIRKRRAERAAAKAARGDDA